MSRLKHRNSTKYNIQFCIADPDFLSVPVTHHVHAGEEGVLTSPNYPEVYAPRTALRWRLTSDSNMFVFLKINDVRVEAYYDSLIVRNNR